MPRIKEEHKHQFTPYFTAAIGGQVLKLTIGEMEKNPQKYANTHLAYMYDDVSRYKNTKQRAVKLNMATQKRGAIFDAQHKTDRQLEVERYKDISKAKRERLKLGLKKKEAAAAKASKEDKAAKAKALKEEKAAAKALKEEKAVVATPQPDEETAALAKAAKNS